MRKTQSKSKSERRTREDRGRERPGWRRMEKSNTNLYLKKNEIKTHKCKFENIGFNEEIPNHHLHFK